MIMVQDGHPLSETKTPIGNHVCVDYSSGSFGDLLRCFISLHNGFEKINHIDAGKDRWGFEYIACEPDKMIRFRDVKNVEDYNLVFKKDYPNANQYTQCYRISSPLPFNNKGGHSSVSVTWKKNDKVHDYHTWDYSEYEIIRQTDHKIIFLILSPYSSYKDTYLKRHSLWETKVHGKKNIELHLKIWEENYLTFKYPKHELNYELEINNLLDKDEETYYNLTKFLDVKPLDNWKDHLDIMKNKVC